MAKTKLPPGHHDPNVRPMRPCDGCGQVDDHPRHAIGDPFNPEEGIRLYHLDCCNCTSCVIQHDHSGQAYGLDLAAHLIANGDELAALIGEQQTAEQAASEQEAAE